MGSRVFTNTNLDTGIYFNSERHGESNVIANDSLTMSNSSTLPLVSPGSQQSRETPEQPPRSPTGVVMSQTVSDYEEPIDSVRRYLQASQGNTQQNFVMSQYETVC